MSVVVRGAAELTNWIADTRVEFDYGEVTDDLFTLEELLENSDVKVDECVLHTYALSGDMQHRHDATHFVAVSMGAEVDVGRLVLMDQIIDGPFLLMFAQGTKLKGFHCHDCAEGWVKWFTSAQNYWKETHHASRSPQDKEPAKSVH